LLDEWSYDRYNEKADRIYRLDADIYFNSTQFTASISPKPLALTLAKDYPQVEQMVRINYQGDILIKKGGDWIRTITWHSPTLPYFKVFTMPFAGRRSRYGAQRTTFHRHRRISGPTIFQQHGCHRQDPRTGEQDYLQDHRRHEGLSPAIPFPPQLYPPLRDGYRGDDDQWLSNNWHSYILVRPGVDRAFLQGRVNAVVDKYLGLQLQSLLHTSIQEMNHQGAHFIYHLMPLEDIHLHSNKGYEMEPNGNAITYVYIFSFIAILILVIACVNFMNLSTARSANRAKEVGIRKVAGSTKGNLITQFLTESVLLSFFSLLLALGIALSCCPCSTSWRARNYMPAACSLPLPVPADTPRLPRRLFRRQLSRLLSLLLSAHHGAKGKDRLRP
jgi:putative ABC transport system permease protein